MKKSIVVAAMALVVILAAGVSNAQQRVFYLAPGERVDYAGAVDDWTGSMAQRQIESTRSMITGPLRDLRRHLDATSGRPDPYYGSGVSPVSAPYRLGARAYDGRGYGSYGTYGYNTRGYDRGYRRPSGYSNGRYGYHGYPNRHYSRLAPRITLRIGGGSEVRAEQRHEEEMDELRAQREERDYESETPRSAEARAYYDSGSDRPSRPAQYKAINGLGVEACINGTLLDAGGRTGVSDPNNIEVAPPNGKTICPTRADFISDDTILVICKKGR